MILVSKKLPTSRPFLKQYAHVPTELPLPCTLGRKYCVEVSVLIISY